MTLESALASIEKALASSKNCSTGLTISKRAFGTHCGPSGSPEIIALIHADDTSNWYGHIVRHPKEEQTFVALLVWSDQLVNAINTPLLFRRFHYWIKDRLCYQACAIQNEDDAYAERSSIEAAASCLARMIRRFHIDLRWPDEDGPHAKDPNELRILGIYGVEGAMRADGSYPPMPKATQLTLVES